MVSTTAKSIIGWLDLRFAILLDTLKDLWLLNLLPENRKLKQFYEVIVELVIELM